MKTKEEILAERYNHPLSKLEKQWISEAMEEYSNQSKAPISFAEWVAENNYHRFELAETVGTDNVEYMWTDSEYQEEHTIEQLYEKFKGNHPNSITPKKQ